MSAREILIKTAPAKAKATGRHRLSIDLSERECRTLERVRADMGIRSWGAALRFVLDVYGNYIHDSRAIL